MIALITACLVSLLVTLFGTPLFIKFLVAREYGQFIRQDGPTAHHTKRGTPTMGGVVIIIATLAGWLSAFAVLGVAPDASSSLVILLFAGLGLIGFLDDFIKISRQRSLGLNAKAKIIGQILIGSVFAVLAVLIADAQGLTPASMKISFIRDTDINLGFWLWGVGLALLLLWVNFLVAAWSNAVNLTDGLDGLATGVSLIVFAGYTLIAVWQSYQSCRLYTSAASACYEVRDPWGLAITSAAIVGACVGFLWWNAAPAQIFMGDTGSLALGGALAGITIFTRTEILAVIIGGLFVAEVVSDVIQIGVFKATRKRVFRMAPLHHHFELKGWQEITIVIRFWLVAALFTIFGVALFYGEWVSKL